jgi:hypothetical protein
MGVDFYQQKLDEFRSHELCESEREIIELTSSTELEYRESIADAWRIALFAMRKRCSELRCFTCGSTCLSFVREYDSESHELDGFLHPNCNGSFVCVGTSFINIDSLFLDGEGRRIIKAEPDARESSISRELES